MGTDRSPSRHAHRFALHGLCDLGAILHYYPHSLPIARHLFINLCHQRRIRTQRTLPSLGTMAPRSSFHAPSDHTRLCGIHLACSTRRRGNALDRRLAGQSTCLAQLFTHPIWRYESIFLLPNRILELDL